MNANALGFMAVFLFSLLLLLFFAAITVTPSTDQFIYAATPPVVTFPYAPPLVTTIPHVGVTYIIQPSDWLNKIARQYNTTVPTILAANPQLTDPDRLTPGQSILIPVTSEP